MREISPTTRFRRDYKRELKGRHAHTLSDDVGAVANLLAADLPLPLNLRDHALGGEWSGYRDCHIKPDLVLIYKYPNEQTLQLVRLGSHSELAL